MKRSISFLAGLLLVTFAIASTVATAGSPRETLSKEAPNVSAWALAGLEETIPTDIRRNLTYLREDLLDEGKSATEASAASYKIGYALCDSLIGALDEHDQAAVRAGYRSAQANANTRVTSADLETRRNYTSWTQYAREQSQRSEIQRQQRNQVSLAKEAVRVEWAERVGALRRNLDESYKRYREALRQDPNLPRSTPTYQEPAVTPPADRKASQPRPPTPAPSSETNNRAIIPLSNFEAGDLGSPLFPGSRWVAVRRSGKEINDLSHTIAIDAAVGALGTSKSMRWNYKFEKVTIIVNCLSLNPGVDLTMFDSISFYIKGQKDAHCQFRIESATPQGRSKHVHMGKFRFTPQWQKVTINLRDPSLSGLDLAKTTQIGFVHGGPGGDENTIWFDEITCHLKDATVAPR